MRPFWMSIATYKDTNGPAAAIDRKILNTVDVQESTNLSPAN